MYRHLESQLLWAALLLCLATSAAGLDIGTALSPEVLAVELIDFDEQGTAFADLVGEQGTMLVFAANTCPYVLDWSDRLPRLASFAAEHGIAFLLVNSNERKRTDSDSPEAMAEFLESLSGEGQAPELPYLVDRDSRLATALGAQRTPEVFLFDGEQQLIYHGALDDHSGPLAEAREHWAADALRQLVDGEPILVPETAPIGCAVLKPRRQRPSP